MLLAPIKRLLKSSIGVKPNEKQEFINCSLCHYFGNRGFEPIYVMNRGRRGQDLFVDKADYQHFESNILKGQTKT